MTVSLVKTVNLVSFNKMLLAGMLFKSIISTRPFFVCEKNLAKKISDLQNWTQIKQMWSLKLCFMQMHS